MVEKAPIINVNNNFDAIMNLVTDPRLRDLYKKVEDEYLYWDKVKYLVPKDVDAANFWGAIKMRRLMQMQTIKFGSYTFSFALTPFNLSYLNRQAGFTKFSILSSNNFQNLSKSPPEESATSTKLIVTTP